MPGFGLGWSLFGCGLWEGGLISVHEMKLSSSRDASTQFLSMAVAAAAEEERDSFADNGCRRRRVEQTLQLWALLKLLFPLSLFRYAR